MLLAPARAARPAGGRRRVGTDGGAAAGGRGQGAGPGWLERFGESLVDELALVRRVRALLVAGEMAEGGGGWPRRTTRWYRQRPRRARSRHETARPAGHLSTILDDLDAIRGRAAIGGRTGAGVIFWLVKDGMVLIRFAIGRSWSISTRAMRRSAIATSSVWRPSRTVCSPSMPKCTLTSSTRRAYAVRSRPLHRRHPHELCRRAGAGLGFLAALVPIVERHLKSGAWPRKVGARRPSPRQSSRRGTSPSTASGLRCFTSCRTAGLQARSCLHIDKEERPGDHGPRELQFS